MFFSVKIASSFKAPRSVPGTILKRHLPVFQRLGHCLDCYSIFMYIFLKNSVAVKTVTKSPKKTSSTISAQHLITTRPDKARLWLSNKHQTVFCIFWWAPCPVHEGIGENSSCRLPVPEAVTVQTGYCPVVRIAWRHERLVFPSNCASGQGERASAKYWTHTVLQL